MRLSGERVAIGPPSSLGLRTESALTPPWTSGFAIRLSFRQHPVRGLGQVPSDRANRLLVAPAARDAFVQPAGVPLGVGATSPAHPVGGFHKGPLQVAVHIRPHGSVVAGGPPPRAPAA